MTQKFKESLLYAKKAINFRETEKKLLELFKKGHITGTVHTSIGQEIIPIILNEFSLNGDWFFSNHRGHSHYLAKTDDYVGLLGEIMSKKNGASRGYGGSQHLINDNFMSNGIQGGMSPVAAGVAYSLKESKSKDQPISVIYIGDGTLGEGTLYESMNLSGYMKLPILFVLEDNGIAQSTLTEQFKLDKLKARFEGFSLNYFESTSDDWKHLAIQAKKAIKSARGLNASVLRVKTNRLFSHSKGDDNRDKKHIKQINDNDPLNKLIRSSKTLQKHEKEFKKELDTLVKKLIEDENLNKVDKYKPLYVEEYGFIDKKNAAKNDLRTQIYDYIDGVLNNKGVFIGEDIKDKDKGAPVSYGGAFKVSKDLSSKHSNVINSSISEACITGFSTGYALTGKPSVCEIMFGDFTTLIVDQVIQHLSKFTTMYGNKIDIPTLIRTPMGGRRGYGPTHSQSLERLFFGTQGVNLFSANHRSNLQKLLDENLSKKEPAILFENKLNYQLKNHDYLNTNYEKKVTNDKSATVIISPINKKANYTIFCYGYTLKIAEDILDELEKNEIFVEIVCPTLISPLNILPAIKSILKTKKLIGIEDGSASFGLTSALIAELYKYKVNIDSLFLVGNETIIPASANAENNLFNYHKEVIDFIYNEEFKL